MAVVLSHADIPLDMQSILASIAAFTVRLKAEANDTDNSFVCPAMTQGTYHISLENKSSKNVF